ncbi:dual specificity protein phosphatase 3 [Anabrus simplex]|uniref:dual specificity protein phosphatase 3 n=1 Tax=Anabrus simplex TaxID=316456 RepID=UPI0034DD76B5
MTSWRDKHPVGFLDNGDETTASMLMETIHITRLEPKPLSRFDRYLQPQDLAGVDADEVYPNVFIGDAGAAKNKQYLKKMGITHVLNTAEGNRFGMVNTNQLYYRDTNIKYMGLQLLDIPITDIGVHFQDASNFIEDGIRRGGKVLVHCLMGMSRSSTCVLAYLMIKENMTAVEALRVVCKNRYIRPNDGFLRQLADLDNKLRRERARSYSKV